MFSDNSFLDGDARQQTIEYLQSQLEELAHEQENQLAENMKLVGRLNMDIQRLNEEKSDIYTSYEKQSSNLCSVTKRLEDKQEDCARLHHQVTELQRKLSQARSSRQQNYQLSEEFTGRLRSAEDKITSFETKLQESMNELAFANDEKLKYQQKIPHLNKKLEKAKNESNNLSDELDRCKQLVVKLQSELDAVEQNNEILARQHLQETKQLKSILRERDNDLTTLRDDLRDKDAMVNSLTSNYEEKEQALQNHQATLNERNNKVLELESKLREYDSELLQLVSQQQEGQIESIRAHDLALYVKSLEEQAYAAQKKNIEIEKQVENLCEKLASNDQSFSDLRKNFEEKEAQLRKEIFDKECLVETKMEEIKLLENKSSENIQKEKVTVQELQLKLDCQAVEVSKLTSHLEDQIYESNKHHRNERSCLEDQLKEYKSQISNYKDENNKLQQNYLSTSEKLKNFIHKNELLTSKVEELEKWETECLEKDKLCSNLQSSCNLLEERLESRLKTTRSLEQQLAKMTSQYEETKQKLEDKQTRLSKLGDELTSNQSEVRKLKDALREESERQLNELNSMVEERLAERDEQISSTAVKVKQLCEVINKKDIEISKLKQEEKTIFNQLHEKIKTKSRELESFKAANSHLQNEFDILKSESRSQELSMKYEVNKFKSMVENLEKEASESSLNNSKLKEDLKAVSMQLEVKSEHGEQLLKSQEENYAVQKEKVKKVIKALQIQVKKLKQEKEKLQLEINNLKEMENTNKNNEVELSAERIKNKESEVIVSSLKEQLESLITSHSEENEFHNKKNADLSLHIDSLKKDIQQLNQEISLRDQKISGLNKEVLLRDEKVNELTEKAHSYVQSTEFLSKKASASDQLSQGIIQRDQKIEQLIEEISAMKINNKEFKESLSNSKTTINDLNEIVLKRDHRIKEIDTELESKKSDCLKLTSSLESCMSELQDARDKNKEFEQKISEVENVSLENLKLCKERLILIESLEDQIRKNDLDNNYLRNEISCLKNDHKVFSENLEEKLRLQNNELKKSLELCEEEKQKSTEGKKLLAQKQSEVSDLRVELEKYKVEESTLKKSINENESLKKKNMIDIQRKLKAALVSRKTLMVKNEELVCQHKKTVSDSKDLQEKLKEISILYESELKNKESLTCSLNLLEEKLNLECSNNSCLIENYKKEIIGLKEGRSRDEEMFKHELESLKQVNVEEISVLKSKLSKESEKLEEFEKKFKNINNLIGTHKEKNDALNEKISSLQSEIKQLAYENKLNKEKLATKVSENQALEIEITNLKESTETLKEDQNASHLDRTSLLEKQLVEASENLKAERNNSIENEDKYKNLETRYNEMLVDFKNLEESNISLQNSFDKNIDKNQVLENKIINMEQQLKTINEELQFEKNEHVRNVGKKDKEIKDLYNEFNKASEKVEFEIEKNSQFEEKIRILETEKINNENNCVIKIERLESQLLSLKKDSKETEHIQQNTSKREQTVVTLQRKLKAALVSRKELLKAKEQLGQEIDAAKSQLVIAQKDLSSSEIRQKGFETSIENIKCERDKAIEKSNQLNSKLEMLVKEKKNTQNSFEKLKIEFDEFNKKYIKIKHEKHELEKDTKKLKSELSDEIQKLESFKKTMNDKFTSQNLEIKVLKEKTSSLELSNRNLKDEVSTLETCNNDLNETASALEFDSSKIQKALAEKSEALRNKQKYIKKLETAQLAADNKESKQIEEIVNAKSILEENFEKLQTSHEISLSEISSLKEELSTTKSTNLILKESHQKEMELNSSHIKKLESSLNNLSDSLKNVEDENKTHIQKIGTLEKENNIFKDTEEQFNILQKDYQSVKSNNFSLKEQVDLLTLAEKDLVQNLKNSAKSKFNLTEDIKNLKMLNEKLNKDVDSLTQIKTKLEKEINDDNKQNVIDDLKKANGVLRLEANLNEEHHENDLEKINSLQIKVESATKACDLLSQKLQSSKEEYTELKTSFEKLNADALSDRKKIENNTSKLLSNNKNLKEKLQFLEAGLLKKTEDWSKLVENNEILKLQVSSKNYEIDQLQQQIEKQTADSLIKFEQQREDVALLKQQFQSKQEEISKLVDEQASQKHQLKIDLEKLHGSNEAELAESKPEAGNTSGHDWVLKNELTNREALISQLITDCNRLKSQLTDARSNGEAQGKRIEAQFTQINSLVALRIQYESNENHLKSQLSEKDRVIERHVRECDTLRLKNENLSSSGDQNDFKDKYEELSKEHELLLGNFQTLQKEKDSSINDHYEIVNRFREEVANFKKLEIENDRLRRNVEESDKAILKLKKKKVESSQDWTIEIPEESKPLNTSNKTNIYHNIPLPSLKSRVKRFSNSLLTRRTNLLSLKNLVVAYAIFIHLMALRCTVHF